MIKPSLSWSQKIIASFLFSALYLAIAATTTAQAAAPEASMPAVPYAAPNALQAAGPPYTTTTTITAVTSGHPGGSSTYMVGFVVWVSVHVDDWAPGGLTPGGTVTVTVASAGPSCTAQLDSSANAECALFFTVQGSKSISASYGGNVTFDPSSTSAPSIITVSALSLTRTLSAGQYHTCVHNPNGSFTCWGMDDAFPVDGNGDPLTITDTTTISAGGYHTCALKTDGSVECWGDNADVRAVPAGQFISLSSGHDHVCAIDTEFKLNCWGTMTPELSAVPTDTVKAVSAGNTFDCAIKKSDSRAACWGIGAGTVPTYTIQALAVGNSHTCAIRSTGALGCWGTPSMSPPSGTNYQQIDSGSNYSCARKSDDRLACWGSGNPGVDQIDTYTDFSSGFLHTCALKDNLSGGHFLACWGLNGNGQAPRLALQPGNIQAYLPQNRPWSQVFSPAGGAAPYTITKSAGNFPNGLALSDHTLSGTPSQLGAFNFTLKTSESFANSSLPLELNPFLQAYTTTVQSPATTVSISSPLSATVGAPVLVNVIISKSATPALSGTVTVTSTDTTATCQATVSGSSANCAIYFGSAGSHTIYARYEGNDFYLPSASDSQPVTIIPIVIDPAVSAGSRFNCSLDADGMPYCWGKNDSGQATPPSGNFSQVSAGNAYACGRGFNSKIFCWGWNGHGVTQPPPDSGFIKVTTGYTHACALHYDGSIHCWGNSTYNRLDVPTTYTYTQVEAGDNHTCALDSNGYPRCWGYNSSGQTNAPATPLFALSSGGQYSCGIQISDGSLNCWGDVPDGVPTGVFKALEAGYNHACALRSDDTLACWGENLSGKADSPPGTFQSVSAGLDHTCALRSDGYLLCWGHNGYGQAPLISFLPVAMPTLDVDQAWSTSITASGGRDPNYTFGIQSGSLPFGLNLTIGSGLLSGTPTQAGYYTYTIRAFERDLTPALIGEKVYTQTVRSKVQVTIPSITPAQPMVGEPVSLTVSVSETPGTYMGVAPSGTVTLTVDGSASYTLTLQNGSASAYLFFTSQGDKSIQASYAGDSYFLPGDNAASPVSITVIPFQQEPLVRSGMERTFIHKADGSLACVGENCAQGGLTDIYTAVGIGDTLVCALRTDGTVFCKENTQPAQVIDEGLYVALSVGKAHACAIRVDGSLHCWGNNGSGQASPPPGTFNAVGAGANHTCAIHTDSSLECWGAVPGTVPMGSYQAVSAGPGHSCALAIDGSLACWGDDTYGQSSPPTSGNYQSVSVGETHSCALAADGTITCWGEDTLNRSAAPYGNFTTISAYADHNCALRSGPRLTCWGDNDFGEAPQILYTALVDSEIVALEYWEHFFDPAGGQTPYQGAITSGALPQGVDFQLSPAGVVLYGTPEVPGKYPFVISWEDSSSIPLFLEQPYTLTVTGAELGIRISSYQPPAALYANDFSFQYVITSATSLAVPDVLVSVEIPEGLSNISHSGLVSCTLQTLLLDCAIDPIEVNQTLTLTVSGLVTALPGAVLTTTAQVMPQLPNWPDVAPQNNFDSHSVVVASQVVAFEDSFDDGRADPRWSGGSVINSPAGVAYLGDFSNNDSLRLLLTNLPPHKRVTLSFDLFAIGAWQGNAGPHRWMSGETGQPTLLDTTFCNDASCRQAYPKNYPAGDYPWRAGASGSDELGNPGDADTRYRMSFSLQHTASVFDFTFSSLGLPPGVRWGLDNVRLVLDFASFRVNLPLVLNQSGSSVSSHPGLR